MLPQLLELHIAQIERAFSNSSNNSYSDQRKEEFHKQLAFSFLCYKNLNCQNLDPSDIMNIKGKLDFIFHNLEYLDTSVKDRYPEPLAFCLGAVLKDWLPNYQKYIILISLGNRYNDYRFENYPIDTYKLLGKEIANIIKKTFKFKYEPIMLMVPRFQSHCFLANAVVYHELGHFIDFRYKIIETLFEEDEYLSKLEDQVKTKSHYKEFFADIFAAQYVSTASNNYLNYIGYKHEGSKFHPPTEDRIRVAEDFLSGNPNEYLDKIIPATEKLTKIKLTQKFTSLPVEDFAKGNPINIRDKTALSSLFPLAWEIWNNHDGDFRKRHGENLLSAHNELNQLMIDSINTVAS